MGSMGSMLDLMSVATPPNPFPSLPPPVWKSLSVSF